MSLKVILFAIFYLSVLDLVHLSKLFTASISLSIFDRMVLHGLVHHQCHKCFVVQILYFLDLENVGLYAMRKIAYH